MKTLNTILAGFGGQGILFAGKVMAYAGLIDEKEISWLPSYGPEMRGGTANCSICISDEPIGSPLVVNPNVLGVMNTPSYDKFIDSVEAGGVVVVDSTLISQKCNRTDITVYYIEATALADEKGFHGLANMIILGKLLKETRFASMDAVKKSLAKCVPPKKAQLIESNLAAIELGMSL
ncbi:2-oxoacid:acceptor oxidoreductase family protein [Acetanaerobacterium elongatum]|uniref:2-oxoglutarate ferredoxin oxidoreductase, gamma subunit n=1 Tax=Acetanaerobacterium elongatum TaxID=258515 RepID=A0A1H0E1D1_9FIRM|nr:2-oxoacid:acceptor oxidoreductase family protein [Acetanaerobacterium elongatum]SDN76128.1 2-oxoglutarate ferredoxin oxidoreductase, gamma subunit [Acetanaerobacterium elongatum]